MKLAVGKELRSQNLKLSIKKKEFKKLFENPHEIMDQMTEEIIDDQLKMKIGDFTADKLDAFLKTKKKKTCWLRQNSSWNMEDREIWRHISSTIQCHV